MSTTATLSARVVGRLTGLFLEGIALGAGCFAGVSRMGWLL